MTEKYKLKQGDMVVMHTCMEHDNPDNFGKIWTCKTDSFRHKGHDYDSIFLDGFSGSFSAEFLQKVDMAEAQKTKIILAEKLNELTLIIESETYWAWILEKANRADQLQEEVARLRKALEAISNPPFIIGSTALQHMGIARDALGIKGEVES